VDSKIDNIAHIAYSQTQRRDRNQTLQEEDTSNNLGISEKDDDDDDGCCMSSGMGRSISQSFNDDTS
jgi:hypothetical protein